MFMGELAAPFESRGFMFIHILKGPYLYMLYDLCEEIDHQCTGSFQSQRPLGYPYLRLLQLVHVWCIHVSALVSKKKSKSAFTQEKKINQAGTKTQGIKKFSDLRLTLSPSLAWTVFSSMKLDVLVRKLRLSRWFFSRSFSVSREHKHTVNVCEGVEIFCSNCGSLHDFKLTETLFNVLMSGHKDILSVCVSVTTIKAKKWESKCFCLNL